MSADTDTDKFKKGQRVMTVSRGAGRVHHIEVCPPLNGSKENDNRIDYVDEFDFGNIEPGVFARVGVALDEHGEAVKFKDGVAYFMPADVRHLDEE